MEFWRGTWSIMVVDHVIYIWLTRIANTSRKERNRLFNVIHKSYSVSYPTQSIIQAWLWASHSQNPFHSSSGVTRPEICNPYWWARERTLRKHRALGNQLKKIPRGSVMFMKVPPTLILEVMWLPTSRQVGSHMTFGIKVDRKPSRKNHVTSDFSEVGSYMTY